MFCQPVCNDLLSHSGLESPDIGILQLLGDDFFQPVLSTVNLADSLMKFQTETAQRGAVLELGLIVNVCGTEPVDLNTACEKES